MSLPCLAWSGMNDDGIPAGCEADIGAIGAHVIVHYSFDRPGFQQLVDFCQLFKLQPQVV